MGIVKRDVNNWDGFDAFQFEVLTILDEYGYEIADLRYIEELKQIVITIQGMVIFVTREDVSVSFEINITPDIVANLILILAAQININNIHITDSFIITKNPKGENIAVFGPDAQEIYERDLTSETYNNKYFNVLMSPNIKFYDC